jgi:2'-5' RNA ligase
MSQLAVVAYPVLSADDRRWIEDIRTRYDPMASRIAAHFTLVFPTDVAGDAMLAHVENAVQSVCAFPVVLRRAATVPDAIGSGHHVFLLADTGYAELLALHESLHDGTLARHKRRDIPFVPHVTVAVCPQPGQCERIAHQLNEERRIVAASIQSVDVIEVAKSLVRTVAEIRLKFRTP